MEKTEALLILIRLFTAHVIGDFLVQPRRWVEDRFYYKGRSWSLYYHALVTGFLTWLFLADFSHWQLPVFIMATHFLTDYWKAYQPDNLRNFVIDQGIHIILILLAWTVYMDFFNTFGTWAQGLLARMEFWVLILSMIIVIWPFGIMVGKFTDRWRRKLKMQGKTGLPDAGKWIGRMERLLVVSFVILSQYQAIGFLIAAKSIFRFNGITENKDRMEAEYILVGTFLSFTLAIVLGLVVKSLFF